MSFFLFFGVMNILCYLALIATWIILNDQVGLNLAFTLVTLGFSVSLVFFYREKFKGIYEGDFFKHFSNAFIRIVMVIFILGLVNFLGFKNPKKSDLSSFQYTTLSQQTLNLLEGIERPIELKVFARKNNFSAIQKLLELYRFENSNIHFSFYDAELKPHLVKKFSINQIPAIVVSTGDEKFITVTKINELEITNALIKATREKTPIFYFTIGHNELKLDSFSEDSGSFFKGLIERNSFRVRTINLSQVGKIPSDAHALVIWGPTSAFFDVELEKICSYLDQGGHLVAAIDPNFNDLPNQKLRALLESYSLRIDNNIVIDRLKHINGSNGSVPLIKRFNTNHPVVKDYQGELFFPVVSSVSVPSGSRYEKEVRPLLFTSPFPASWAENNLQQFLDGKSVFNEKEDQKGPVTLASSVITEKESKIVALGNSTFVSNNYQKFSSNFIFAMNIFSWIGDEDRLIAFETPGLKDEPIFMSGQQKSVIFYFSVLFLPILLSMFALFVFLRRKRL